MNTRIPRVPSIRCTSSWPAPAFWLALWLALFLATTPASVCPLLGQTPPPASLVGHTAAVNAAVYTPDQRHVVTVSADQTVKIWVAATGEELRTLRGHTGQVLSVAASPDGLTLVSGAADNTIRMWDVPRPEPIQDFAAHKLVRNVAVSLDGKWAVCFSEDKMGKTIDLKDGSVRLQLKGLEALPTTAAIRPDSALIASGDEAGQILTWETLQGELGGALGAHQGPVRRLAFHPNNQQMISAGKDGLLKIWQLPLPVSRTINTTESQASSIAMNSDGSLMVLGGADGVGVYNPATGQLVRELSGSPATSAVAISSDNAFAAAVGASGATRVWKLTDGVLQDVIWGGGQPVSSLAFHPDNRRLATGEADGALRIWRLPAPRRPLAGHTAAVTAVDISHNGQWAATASADKSVRLWATASSQAGVVLAGHEHPLSRIAFRPDDAQLASGDASGEVRLWNPADGADQGVIGAHDGSLRGLAYAKSGDQLATVGDDRLLKVWHLPVPPPVALAGNADAVAGVALLADQKTVLTAGADKSMRLFDSTTGQQMRVLSDAPGPVTTLALSPDNKTTAAGTAEGSIKLWNTDGAPWYEGAPESAGLIQGHDGQVNEVAFGPKSDSIVTAGADGTVRHWRLPQPPVRITDDGGEVSRFVVSRDGKRTASAGTFQGVPAVIVREHRDDRAPIIRRLLGHQGAITSAVFQADGTKLATGGADGGVIVWDLTKDKFPQVVSIATGGVVVDVALSDDGAHVFAAVGTQIHQHSVTDGSEVRKINHNAAVSSLAVAGPKVYSGGADNYVRGWSIASGAASGAMNHTAAVTTVRTNRDGSLIATAGADHQIRLWNATNGAAAGELAGHAATIVDLAFAGTTVVSVATDGVFLWDVVAKRRLEVLPSVAEAKGVGVTGGHVVMAGAKGVIEIATARLIQIWDAHAGGAHAVAWTPDATKIVSGGADKTAKVWNIADGKPIAVLGGPMETVTGVAVVDQGKAIIAASLDKTLRQWTMPAAAVSAPLAAAEQWGFGSPLIRVRSDATGNRLAIAGQDQTLRLWDRTLERELERFAGHVDAVLDIVISTDGQKIISGSADKTALLHTTGLVNVVNLGDLEANSPEDVAPLTEGQWIVAGLGETLTRVTVGQTVALRPLGPPAAGADFVSARQMRVATTADGKNLASLDVNGRVNSWSPTDGKLIWSAKPAEDKDNPGSAAPTNATESEWIGHGGLRFSSDAEKIVAGWKLGVRLVRMSDGETLQRWIEAAEAMDVALLPNGESILTGHAAASDNAALRSSDLQHLIKGHEGPISSVAFSMDGSAVLSGGMDRTVRKWSLEDGAKLREYEGAEDQVRSLAVTKDGTRIIAGCADAKLRLWEMNPEGQEPVALASTFTTSSDVTSISASVDNQKVAVANGDGLVQVVELERGKELQRFAGYGQAAVAVVFAPDNQTLISAGADKSVRVDTMALVRSINASEGPLNDFVLAAQGTQAVTAAADGVRLWNLATGALVRELTVPATRASEASKPATEEPTDPPPPLSVAATCVAVRSDNTLMAAVDQDQNFVVWNMANGQVTGRAKTKTPASWLQFSADGQRLVALCDDQLQFMAADDGAVTYELTSELPLQSAAFLPDGRTVVTGGEQLRKWRFASPDAVRTLTGHGGGVLGVAYSPSGRWIASASADQTIRIWDAQTGAQVKQLSGHQGAAYSVAFSPDESLLVSCGAEKGLRVWDVLGGRQLKQIPMGDAGLYSVVVLPDGKRVAAAGVDRKIYMLDLLTGVLERTMDDHPDFLYRLALNRTGTRLLSCGYSGNIMLWNAANGQLLHRTEISSQANFADVSPDGGRLVVASGDGRAYFLDVPANAK